jgi:PAS domain S-box-containing protein
MAVEKALEEQTSFLQILLDTLPTPLFYKDLDGRYTGCNNAFTEFTGRPRDQIIGKTVHELWPEEMAEVYYDADLDIFSNSRKQEYESDIMYADGSIHQVRFYKAPLVDNAGQVTGLVGVFVDVTDQKKGEAALSESNQRLRLLTSLTRHDIFNQLNAIQIFLSMVMRAPDPDNARKNISLAQEAGRRIENAIRFTREYEDFGSFSSGWQNVYQMIEKEKNQLSSESLDISNMIPDSVEVYADPIIRKVFATLLDNALRHGQHVKNIVFSCIEVSGDLVIICDDDGVGIAHEDKPYIFDHGYGNNTGFGLFLAKEILAITGLEIAETGEPGKGARFEIVIPSGKHRRNG